LRKKKRGYKKEYCPKRCFYWGVPNAPKKLGDGPINMAPSKKEKKF